MELSNVSVLTDCLSSFQGTLKALVSFYSYLAVFKPRNYHGNGVLIFGAIWQPRVLKFKTPAAGSR